MRLADKVWALFLETQVVNFVMTEVIFKRLHSLKGNTSSKRQKSIRCFSHRFPEILYRLLFASTALLPVIIAIFFRDETLYKRTEVTYELVYLATERPLSLVWRLYVASLTSEFGGRVFVYTCMICALSYS
jgi:hypothetical protein